MNKLNLRQIITASGGRLLQGDETQYITGVSIDSRTASAGNLFAAIRGENTDGHKFTAAAFENGCSAALIDDSSYTDKIPEGMSAVLVDDTVKALQDIASYYREHMNIKVIGVTGSVGKTGTSDMVKAVCGGKFKTAKTKGNFNNHIGLPLSILGFDPDTEIGILEMGMDRPGEIEFLAGIAKPDIGIITNIGTAHIEYLGSRENIFKAKMEITAYFGKDNVLIVNGDDDFLGALCDTEYRLVKVGAAAGSQVYVYNINDSAENGVEFTLEYKEKATRIQLTVPGRHNAVNAALAIAAGLEAGVSVEEAAAGLQSLEFTDKRLSVKGKNGIKVIDDTYNASPASMKAAIDVLMSAKGLRKVAILGDMFEQGKESPRYHTEVGEYASDKSVDMLIAIGDDAEYIKDGALKSMSAENVKYYKTKNEFLKEMKNIIKSGDVVLVKGSRGMAMDLIVKRIME